MNEIKISLKDIAGQYRLGYHVEAGLLLPDVLEQVIESSAVDQTCLGESVYELLAAQQRRDWLGMADVIEYELLKKV